MWLHNNLGSGYTTLPTPPVRIRPGTWKDHASTHGQSHDNVQNPWCGQLYNFVQSIVTSPPAATINPTTSAVPPPYSTSFPHPHPLLTSCQSQTSSSCIHTHTCSATTSAQSMVLSLMGLKPGAQSQGLRPRGVWPRAKSQRAYHHAHQLNHVDLHKSKTPSQALQNLGLPLLAWLVENSGS